MPGVSQLDGLIDLLVEAVLREIKEAKARQDGSPERANEADPQTATPLSAMTPATRIPWKASAP